MAWEFLTAESLNHFIEAFVGKGFQIKNGTRAKGAPKEAKKVEHLLLLSLCVQLVNWSRRMRRSQSSVASVCRSGRSQLSESWKALNISDDGRLTLV